MKTIRSIVSALLLTTAFGVTVGAMYVTTSAAQEAQEAPEAAPIPLPEIDIAPQAVPEVPDDVPAVNPDDVLADRVHAIRLDANGAFTGRISTLTRPDGNLNSAAGMKVKLIREGIVQASTVTDSEGSFSVTGQTEGVSSLFAWGDQKLLMYSVRMLDADVAEVGDATPVKAVELAISTAAVDSTDFATVAELVFSNLPAEDKRFNEEVEDEEESYPHGDGEGSTSLIHHPVQLQANGNLVGQINLHDPRTGRHREVQDLTLHFIRNGEHVGATQVDPDGGFVMAGLNPGVHSIATTGRDGVLALGVDIVGTTQLGQNSRYKLSSVAQQLDLVVSPVTVQDINQFNINQITDGEFSSPTGAGPGVVIGGPIGPGVPFGPGGGFGMPGGGAGGALGGGGGGGVGGGGGLGTLLGAAAAGAIGYAVGENESSPNR